MHKFQVREKRMNGYIRTALSRSLKIVLFCLILGVQLTQGSSQDAVAFERIEVMVPLRDGVKLFTVILTPKKASEQLPILIQRTPSGVDRWTSERLNLAHKELVADGYIFVFQDIRGKYKSEGEFRMNRPPRDKSDAKSIDESTDTYDSIEWLIKNIKNNNGRVGVFGVSYPGWLAVVPLLDPHPALKALSPQALMGDTWLGDDFFHQGAFRMSYGYEYVYGVENAKGRSEPEFDKFDTYEWYLKRGAISKIITPA